ncbi:Hint domain-containing protein [Acetobacter pasteurianus]|nr:Hint domain-containing protein [Acetobacter pasteurianus]
MALLHLPPPSSGDTVVIDSDNNPTISLEPGSNGWVQSATVEITGSGTVTFNGGATSSNNFGNITIDSGATLKLENATDLQTNTGKGISGGTVIVSGGSTLSTGDVSQTVIKFGDADSTGKTQNTVSLSVSNAQFGTVQNLSPGDILEIPGASTWYGDGGTWSQNNDGTYKLTGNDSNHTVLISSATLAPGITTSDFTWDNSTASLVCFLPGSMIRTPDGDVAVEDIQIGDQVVVFDWEHNKEVTRPVVWVGKARATVRAGLPDDEAGYPVRILKNAIADGVPYKDMLITAEHCLFFKNRFVPVRMLVNGMSIYYDKSLLSYDYYHLETEQHSVITADGMLTESYLDTGNRSSFRQEGKVATLRGTVKNWKDNAAAPLGVDRSFVEPLFRALEWRENSVVGCQIAPETVEMTNDPGLHLLTRTGAVIRPMRKTEHHYSFMLPPNTDAVRIISRANRPSDVIGPFVDDRRNMGVAVGKIHLQCAKQQIDITSHLQENKPAGWHATDWTDCAWTNGDAVLPLTDFLSYGKMGILSITLRAAGPYLTNTRKNFDMKKLLA